MNLKKKKKIRDGLFLEIFETVSRLAKSCVCVCLTPITCATALLHGRGCRDDVMWLCIVTFQLHNMPLVCILFISSSLHHLLL